MNIAEVSKKFGLTADTLRYYERIGLLPAVARNKSGNRDYSSIDCERIEFIKCMREAGLSIEVLTRYMHLFLEGDSTLKEREELLIAERDRLESRLQHMQETLSRLNHKIELTNRAHSAAITWAASAFKRSDLFCTTLSLKLLLPLPKAAALPKPPTNFIFRLPRLSSKSIFLKATLI